MAVKSGRHPYAEIHIMVMDSRSRRPLQRSSGGGVAKRYYMMSHAYIKNDDPDANFGDPDTAIMYREFLDPGNTLWYGIFKFDRQIIITPADFTRYLCLFAATPLGLQYHVNSALYNYQIQPWAIRSDFDTSTITWNIYNGLTKSVFGEVRGRKMKIAAGDGSQWEDDSAGFGGFVFYRDLLANISALNGAYGLALVPFNAAGELVGDFYKMTVDREPVGSNYAGYLELF